MIAGRQLHSGRCTCGSSNSTRPPVAQLQARLPHTSRAARAARLRDVAAQARRGRPRKEEAAAAEAAFKEVKLSSAGSNWDMAGDDDFESSSGFGWDEDFDMQQQYLQQRLQQAGDGGRQEGAEVSSSLGRRLGEPPVAEEEAPAPFNMFGVRQDEIVPLMELPAELEGRDRPEADYIMWLAKRQFQFQREWHYEEVLDAAFESHHHQMENSVNMFATINRMSQVLTQVELEDVMNPERDQTWLPSWARAEIVFGEHFDEFNEYMKENIELHVRKPLAMEQDDDFENLDEVMVLASGIEQEVEEEAPEEKQKKVLDSLLDGVLPGASLSSLSRSYMDDIFAGADEDEELLDLEEELLE